MTTRHFEFVKFEVAECPSSIENNKEFEQNFQTALLLSLLQKKLLNQCQFERCLDELKKDKSI